MNVNTGQQISISVVFFGAARDAVTTNPLTLSLDSPCTVAGAFEVLARKFPELRRFGRSLLFAINQQYASSNEVLQQNDELAVFPPVSGGATADALTPSSSQDFFEITTDPIDVGSAARRVVLAQCGATVSLDGYAREWTHGRRTLYLIYEAYEEMALKEMRRLAYEARQRFEIAHIGIVHRIGRVEIGETSVVIAVSAPHRHAAFEACEWAIRELKRTVPIWKKEIFEGGEVWVEGDFTSASL